MRSYIVGGVRSEKSRMQAAYFQTLNMLHLQVYHRPAKALNRLKEVNVYYIYQTLPYEPFRSALGLFMAEVFASSVKEEEPSAPLYAFLEQQLLVLDQCPAVSIDNLLQFLIQLAGHLGFRPAGSYTLNTPDFNLKEGRFEKASLLAQQIVTPPMSVYLSALLQQQPVSLTPKERMVLLDHLLHYYSLHIPEFRTPRSLSVLRIVFRSNNH